jgi:inorganic pyrophosphatase
VVCVVCLQLLGSLGMIDSNESDWKVVVINAADPLAASYNDISDVPKVGAGDTMIVLQGGCTRS